MKNSFRVIGISIIFWLGLSIGQANAITAPTVGTTSNPSSFSNPTESSPTNNASLQAPGLNNKFADRAADAGKGSLVSEHQTYAMLLVGLGLLVFSARHRRDAI